MAEENLPEVAAGGFEGLKKVNEYSAEYWSARDLQPLLGYNHWRSFEKAVQKSVTSCEQSGNDPSHHFAPAQNGRDRLGGVAGGARLPPFAVRVLPNRSKR